MIDSGMIAVGLELLMRRSRIWLPRSCIYCGIVFLGFCYQPGDTLLLRGSQQGCFRLMSRRRTVVFAQLLSSRAIASDLFLCQGLF